MSSSETIKKRYKWSVQKELVLLKIWESNIENLRKAKRNSHVYNEMAIAFNNLMSEDDVLNRIEVKNKISNLTQRYRTEIKVVGPNGESPSKWHLFGKVHKILRSFPVSHSDLVTESNEERLEEISHESAPDLENVNEWESASLVSLEASSSSSRASSSSPTPITPRRSSRGRKRKSSDFQERLLAEIKRANDLAEWEAEENVELINIQRKICDSIEKLAERFNNN